MAKRGLCILLALAAVFSLSAPALAEEEVVATEEPVVTEEPVEAAEPVEAEEAVEEAAEEAEDEPEAEPEEEPAAEPETAATSGTCGDNVTWSLSGGTLTISGTGKMKDFSWEGAPWYGLREQITTAIIKNGVTSIGNWAFDSCRSLKSLTIPDSVTSIGSGAFQGCDGLTSITIPASVTSIGDGGTFNADITDIIVAEGNRSYTSVDGVLFNFDKTELICYPHGKTATSYAIPHTVKTIGDTAFANCADLMAITIPASVTSLGRWVFSNCLSLTDVTIPASVTSIGDGPFLECPSLASVTILNPNCDIFDERQPDYPFFSHAVIKGYAGSTAQTYANKYGYKFESLGPAPATPTPKPTATPKPQATAVPTLSAPTVTIAQASAGIQVSWNAVAGSPRYMVYYKENNGGWTKIGTTTSTTYTRAAKYLKSGATYQFTVRCCANDKKTLLSPYKASNSQKYTATLAAPSVTISSVSTGIKVSWNAVAGSPRYMVYYKENNGGWTKIGTTTSTTYTRAAKYLKSGATYQFTVRCCANDKKTLLSPYKASNSLKYTPTLAAPTVTISKVSADIKVTWNAVAGSPRYMVYYKENNGGWTKIGTTTSTTYTRAAKYLKSGATYTFTVRCCANDKKTLLGPYKASNSITYKK